MEVVTWFTKKDTENELPDDLEMQGGLIHSLPPPGMTEHMVFMSFPQENRCRFFHGG